MTITLKCFATLAEFQPEDADNYPVAPGATPLSVMQALSIPPEEVNIIFINGVAATLESPLKDGDRLGLFPAVGGG